MAYEKADYFGIISKTSAVDYLETRTFYPYSAMVAWTMILMIFMITIILATGQLNNHYYHNNKISYTNHD